MMIKTFARDDDDEYRNAFLIILHTYNYDTGYSLKKIYVLEKYLYST